MRDVRRLGSLAGADHSQLSPESIAAQRLQIQSQGTWLISRDASPAMTFFATLRQKGTDWFRAERRKALENARLFRELVHAMPDLFEPLPCSNTIVAFAVRGHPRATRTVAEVVNQSNEGFIGYNQSGKIRTANELEQAEAEFKEKGYSPFDNLWANFYPFQNASDVEQFFEFVRQAALSANK